MEISVTLENDFLPDKYTKHAESTDKIGDIPVVSFPIEVKDLPEGTETLALTLIDYDAVPVAGFPWIHWIAADISADINVIPENNSQNSMVTMTQGNNSTAGKYINNTDPKTKDRYFGPTPPNGVHNYELTVFALDTTLDLKEGFWLNELRDAMQGHMLDGAKLLLPVEG